MYFRRKKKLFTVKIIIIILTTLSQFVFSQTNENFDYKKAYRSAKTNKISKDKIKEYIQDQYDQYIKSKILTNNYKDKNDGFDAKNAYKAAELNGVRPENIDEYVQNKHFVFLDSVKNSSVHSHNANEGKEVYFDENNKILAGPQAPLSPLNSYCPNAGFDFYNFTNWTGTIGNLTLGGVGAPSPIYTIVSPGIFNAAGINAGLNNATNYHTVMTTPPTNSVYPMCIGYDSVACKVIGGITASEIPVVNPMGGSSSVRMNAIRLDNAKGTTLTYSMALNPNNKNFSIAYALVFNNGNHSAPVQQYFSVKVKDQAGVLIPGCSIYTVTCNSNLTNSLSPLYDPNWANSSINTTVMYRKWSTVNFDMSAYPLITSVTIEFYVGGCAAGAHYGYAYVDAECSIGGATASFCAGTTTAIVTAPAGYQTYSWVGPLGPISILNGGNTASANISPVLAGQVYTCTVSNGALCNSSYQTTITVTSTSITSIFSTPSCSLGSTGSASVTATGSSSGYIYQWVNSLGAVVSNSQAAVGLPPGTYTAIVSSPGCGVSTSTVIVGVLTIAIVGTNVGSSCPKGSNGWASVTASGGGSYTYQWTNGLGAVVSNSQVAVGLPVGIYTGVVSSLGCGSNSVVVTISATPTHVMGGGNFGYYSCNTALVTTPPPNPIMPGTNYAWYTPSGSVIPDATSSTITIVGPVNFSYYSMAYTTIDGCRDSVRYSFAPTAVYQNYLNYCQQAPTANVTSPYLAGASSIVWYNSSSAIMPGVTTPTYVLTNPIGQYMFSVTYTSLAGCRDTLVIFVEPNLYSDFYVSDVISICPGSSNSSAVLNMLPYSNSYTFTAMGPGGYSAISNNISSPTFSITGLSVGVYTVTGNDGACLTTQTFSVIPYVFTYSLSPLSPTICLGSGVQLTTTYCNLGSPTCALVPGAPPNCSSIKQYEVGFGKTQNDLWSFATPYYGSAEASHIQMLYKASDLINSGVRPGLLTSLAFDVGSLNLDFAPQGHVLTDYTIKLKCTNTQSITAIDFVGLSQVYTIPSYTVGLGINTHSFSTNYSWDGVSNILVDICAGPNGTLTPLCIPSSPFSYTSYCSIVADLAAGASICNSLSGNPLYLFYERPNAIFGNVELSYPSLNSYTWTPTTFLSPINSYTTFVSPITTTVYSVQVQSLGMPNCLQVQSSTVTVVNNTLSPIGATIMCNPSTSTLNVSTTALGISTYTWSGPGILSGANTQTPTVNLPGNYTVTSTDAAVGCSSSTVVAVTSNTTLPVIASAINSGSITCISNTSTLTGTSAGNTLTWNGGALVNATNPATVNVAGTYSITATNTVTGCVTTSVVAVTTNTTLPVITSASSSNNLTCSNTTATLTGTSAGNTLEWNGGALVNATNPATVNSAGIYTVTTIDAINGCTNTSTVSVLASGVLPLVSVLTPLQITCTTPTVTLTGTSAGNTLTWNGGALVNATNPATVNVAGTYSITATNTVTGCSVTTTVGVLASGGLPSVAVAAPLQITCTAPTVTLIGSSATPSVTYQWTAGSAAATQTVNAAGNYTLTVTNTVTGCSSSTIVTVTTNTTLPVITSAINSGSITCINNTSTLSATSAGSTLVWNGGALVNSANPSIVSSAGIYTVTATNATNGCLNTATVTAISNTVTPIITAVVSSGSITCTNATSTLTGTSAGNTLLWSGSGIVSPLNPAVVSAAGIYTVTSTNATNGCVNNATISVASNISLPTLTVSASSTINCITNTAQVTGSSSTSGVTYSWSGVGITAGGTTSSVTVNAAGIYSLTVTSSSTGCSSTTTVLVNASPSPTASVSPDVTIFSGASTTLTAGGGGAYLWNNGPTTSSQVVAPKVTTNYCVIVTDGSGCTNQKCVLVTVELSCYTNDLYETPTAFTPNNDGMNDQFGLQGWDECTTSFFISIYDRWGEKIFESEDVNFTWDGSYKGQALGSAVFVYYIKADILKVGEINKKGNITLIR